MIFNRLAACAFAAAVLSAGLMAQAVAVPLAAPSGLPERINLLINVEESQGALRNPAVIAQLYQTHHFAFQWFDAGQLTNSGKVALQALASANSLGLNLQDYAHPLLEKAASEALSAFEQLEAELLLTDRVLLFAQHVKHGRLLPDTLLPNHQLGPVVIQRFSELMAEGRMAEQLPLWFESLKPKQRAYQILAKELQNLRSQLPQILGLSQTLKFKDHSPEVARLRELLTSFGYLSADQVIVDTEVFDSALQKAVMNFQVAHSLESDGVVGTSTRMALDRLLNGDLTKILVNMERWRWMPETFGSDYIAVNIANFDLNYFHEGQLALTMKTIVGKNYRKTPIFSQDMRYFVVNPKWNVPHMIASKDLLPKIQKNPDFLADMNMVVWRGWGDQQERIDPATVDWQQLTPKNFPYRLQQMPGPKNALGVVKFMFPNEHNVYLHDTNDRALFAKSQRTFSSGCIRLEKPVALLELIAQHHAGLDAEAIAHQLDSGQEKTVLLKQSLPVHIQYWTTWIDTEGRVHYRHDIYERDQAIAQGLQAIL